MKGLVDWPINEFFSHHHNNLHKFYFTLNKVTPKCCRLIRNGEDGGYNYVNGFKLPLNSKSKYTILIKRTHNGHIFIGFCTEKGLGRKLCSNQSLYYYCGGQGKLNEEGNSKTL